MYKRVKIKKLGRTRTHRESLIRNQLRSLFTSGYVSTTTVKAKVLKANAEKLLNRASQEVDLNLQRSLSEVLGKRELVDAVLDYSKKSGTGVKMMKVSFRDGDNAQVSKVELVGYTPVKKVSKGKKKAKATPKEQKVENEKPQNKGKQPRSLGKRVKETFSGQRQRATSRSGL